MQENEAFDLTGRVVGSAHFAGTLQITDPCYDENVPCRMQVQVHSGEYTCVAWEHSEHYTFDGKSYTETRVLRSGIYLDGKVPEETQMEKIGQIGVDAGLAGFFTYKPNYTRAQWLEFCDTIKEGNAWLRENGFFTESGWGDGLYDVLACQIDGQITALEIVF